MNDYRMNWTLPALPLGPAITPQRIEIDRKAMEAAEFEAKRYEINGAADREKCPRNRGFTVASPMPVASPPFKVGDRVRLKPDNISAPCFGPGFVVRIDKYVFVLHETAAAPVYTQEPGGWYADELELA